MCSEMAAPAVGPKPGTTLITPGGKPAAVKFHTSFSLSTKCCQTGLLGELRHGQSSEGGLLGQLHHDSVARGQGGAQLPGLGGKKSEHWMEEGQGPA